MLQSCTSSKKFSDYSSADYEEAFISAFLEMDFDRAVTLKKMFPQYHQEFITSLYNTINNENADADQQKIAEGLLLFIAQLD